MRHRKRRGFSLIELLVVVTILGILAAIVVVNVGGATSTARVKSTVTQISALKQAVASYHALNGKYPSNLETLTQPDPKYSNKAYIEKVPTDGWDNAFIFKKTKGGFEIISYGENGVRGGEGADTDISSKDLGKFK